MYKMLYNSGMKVGGFCNKETKKFIPIRDRLFRSLEENKIESEVYESVEAIGDIDVLIVLGGDGTILRVAIEAGRRGICLLGINAGHLGFLTQFEGEQVTEAVRLLCKGFQTESRSVLQVEAEGHRYFALNDALFQRSYDANADNNVVCIGAEIDGKKVDDFVGDGIIVSTPTGSTAYSLSAGGSILTPDIGAFILTPVCAHSLHNRPIVYGDASVMRVTFAEGEPAPSLYCDGRLCCVLHGGAATVRKADFSVRFVRSEDNFFDKLLFKLNKWSK